MFDISICLPTYNRAKLLQQCLDHLANFTDTSFELIVGDNASDDDTQAVLASMSGRFPHFVSLPRKTNVGFARNMDSLLRRATRKYVYILSDDDIVFEEALQLCASVMDANADVVAIVGQYIGVRELDSAMRIDYSDAVATTVPQGAHALLFGLTFNEPHICDGNPIMRRETFERHCAYLDRTGTLIPLYFTLLQYGNVIKINKPFIQHHTTPVSLTSRMADAWFLDMANADIELAISGYIASLPLGSLQTARSQLLQLLYLQAARMSLHRRENYLVWLFLRRLMAVEGAPAEMLIKCEYHFSHDFLVERMTTILKDSGLDSLHYVDTDITRTLVNALVTELPDMRFTVLDADPSNEEICLLICENRPDAHDALSAVSLLAVNDLFGQIRMTEYQGWLASVEQRIFVQYADPDALQVLLTPSNAFQILCSPYSEAE